MAERPLHLFQVEADLGDNVVKGLDRDTALRVGLFTLVETPVPHLGPLDVTRDAIVHQGMVERCTKRVEVETPPIDAMRLPVPGEILGEQFGEGLLVLAALELREQARFALPATQFNQLDQSETNELGVNGDHPDPGARLDAVSGRVAEAVVMDATRRFEVVG